MGTAAKLKQRAYRARRKDGRRVLHIEVAEVPLIESLIATGFLHRGQQDDVDALEKALGRVIEIWTVTGNGTPFSDVP